MAWVCWDEPADLDRRIPLFCHLSRSFCVHPSALSVDALLADCVVRTSRRSGPGGQHRNKVETAVIIEHLPTKIVSEANERRSQQANREVAIQRLRLKLAVHFRSSQPKSPVPFQQIELPEADNLSILSNLWNRRVSQGRIGISVEHEEFPAMLAELLDQLQIDHWNVSLTASKLQSTGSQLVKLLRKYPPALVQLNNQRKQLGLDSLQ